MARTGGIARIVVGIAAGLLIALGSGGLSADDVGARQKNVATQNEWVDLCRENGGTPRSEGPRTVSCTFPGGSSITCNFRTLVCTVIVVTHEERAAPTQRDPLIVLDLGGAVAVSPVASSTEPSTTSAASGDASMGSSVMSPLD